MADTQDLQASTTSHRDAFEDDESLTPLEQEVLDEYARLLGNLNNVRLLSSLPGLSSLPNSCAPPRAIYSFLPVEPEANPGLDVHTSLRTQRQA